MAALEERLALDIEHGGAALRDMHQRILQTDESLIGPDQYPSQ
jgi:hypothetical protein